MWAWVAVDDAVLATPKRDKCCIRASHGAGNTIAANGPQRGGSSQIRRVFAAHLQKGSKHEREMAASNQNVAGKPATNIEVIRRRPIGKALWKLTIYELIDSERAGLQALRSIGNRHVNDVDTQRLVATAALEAAERMSQLHELLQYRSEEPNETENNAAKGTD